MERKGEGATAMMAEEARARQNRVQGKIGRRKESRMARVSEEGGGRSGEKSRRMQKQDGPSYRAAGRREDEWAGGKEQRQTQKGRAKPDAEISLLFTATKII